MLLSVQETREPVTFEEMLLVELVKLAQAWMNYEEASLDGVFNVLGNLNGALVTDDGHGCHLHQCALEGLQTIIEAFLGLQYAPYNQVCCVGM